MDKVLALSGTQQAALIRDGGISSAELVNAHLARIEEVNPALNAVVEVLREAALQEAAAVERVRELGDDRGELRVGSCPRNTGEQ